MLRLEDYLDRSKLKHHSALARQEFVLHQQMAEQEKEKENFIFQDRAGCCLEKSLCLIRSSVCAKRKRTNLHAKCCKDGLVLCEKVCVGAQIGVVATQHVCETSD